MINNNIASTHSEPLTHSCDTAVRFGSFSPLFCVCGAIATATSTAIAIAILSKEIYFSNFYLYLDNETDGVLTPKEGALLGENIINILFNLADVLSIILPVLLSIAFMTIIERKQLAAHQRRVGPNTVGYYGILQPFADALKLILKETIIPSQSNKIVFYLAPVSTLVFSLLGWAVIPFGEGIVLSDLSLGILYTLALSSLGVYGVLLAGWSANSKYAFLGSLRSTAAMISYELVLSSAILIIILLTGTLNYTSIIEIQQSVWFIIPLLPVFIFYFISILAETSRTPFDLQEAKPVFLK
jgi:NADH-ubiquinone oxidoreductase chain 1